MSNRKSLSKKDLETLLDLINFSLSCEDEACLKKFMEGLSRLLPHGYSTCVIGSLGKHGLDAPYHHLNINYPQEWSEIYAERQLHFVDPIFKEHFASFQMQYWRDTYDKCPPDAEFLSLSRDFGLSRGYTYGVHNPNKTKGSLVSISGDNIERNPRTEYILRQLTPHIHLMLERIVRQDRKKRYIPKLSPREMEVLKWVSRGKTDWEISVILGLSKRTVHFYMSTLMTKLDAVSRTHATAIALDLGLVELD